MEPMRMKEHTKTTVGILSAATAEAELRILLGIDDVDAV
jgi:hypothetical protein